MCHGNVIIICVCQKEELGERKSGTATSGCYTEARAYEPFPDINQKISQWKHSKYNKGRQRFKALCGDQK